MIEFDEAIVNNLIFHKIGSEQTMSFLNESEYNLNSEEEEETLKRIFLKPFTSAISTYEFSHDIDIELNVLFSLIKGLLKDEPFIEKSQSIHQHLKSVSKHPNIKEGELFVLKFDNLKMGNNYYQGVGIYKIENKENFIETSHSQNEELGLNFKKGIGTRKLDKACLILATEEPYTVLIIDNASIETDYWVNDFAKVKLRKDYINSTSQFLTLTKSFITDQITNDFEVTKAEQIDLLNRSVDYFKTHDTFEKEVFEKEVFQESSVINSFRSFDTSYCENNDLELSDSFEISSQAVKKQARIFKSVLKLDKNFHIYIHGDKDLIEQGVEKDGRKFYKIYYQDES